MLILDKVMINYGYKGMPGTLKTLKKKYRQIQFIFNASGVRVHDVLVSLESAVSLKRFVVFGGRKIVFAL